MPQIANRLRRPLDPSLLGLPHSGVAMLASAIAAACDQPFALMRARIKAALARAALDPDLLTPEQRQKAQQLMQQREERMQERMQKHSQQQTQQQPQQ